MARKGKKGKSPRSSNQTSLKRKVEEIMSPPSSKEDAAVETNKENEDANKKSKINNTTITQTIPDHTDQTESTATTCLTPCLTEMTSLSATSAPDISTCNSLTDNESSITTVTETSTYTCSASSAIPFESSTPTSSHPTTSLLQVQNSSVTLPSSIDMPPNPSSSFWYTSIMNKLEEIIGSVSQVNKKVAILESEMRAVHVLNDRVTQMDSRLTNIEPAIDQIRIDVSKANEELNITKRQLASQMYDINETKKKLVDIENRSMRDNLIFLGIPESQNENPEAIVQAITTQRMGLEGRISFERVHRMGQKRDNGRARPIVAKFSHYKDRENLI